ncbi:unnamed protein product [Hermetia illucens]|uniref:Mitochondrial 3-ketoacyl-coa thiolase n=1 Tax=Hermetia illucens TaxID=343691 RepID=A0A7R8V5Q8_HERIL|nr:3-ketoacyl-CoA thiolase, mitochondrial [Hermetia illucens]CAD7092617.1 unnamed protein product [Hermetia illucens]
MSSITKGVFVVAAKRTAFGTFGGAFKNTSATQLQTVAAQAALNEAGLKGEQIDSTVIGNVISSAATDGIYLARHVGLQCNIPIDRPALTVNRLCGSGFQSVVNGAQEILLGVSKVVLTGGAENMSQTPFAVRNVRFGTALGGKYIFEDCLWESLTDSYCKTPMGMTAENLATKYKLTRDEVDQFALRSQHNWKRAQDEGVFKAEIVPIKLKIKGKEVDFAVDEHPRPQTKIEGLSKLPTIFKKDGTVTAGSASGVSDGAAAVILASEAACKEYNLKPLARLAAYSAVGVPPEIMGIGPVPAIQNVLKLSGLSLNDIDVVEINEAFGSQTISCAKELKLDMEKLNPNGGAIALGHPLAASGSRITSHLVHEIQRKKLKRAIGSACIGGGQGIAVLLEAV